MTVRSSIAGASPSSRRRVGAVVLGLALAAIVVVQLQAMHDRGDALVGDEARTAVDALDALQNRPRVGVPTTSNEFIDRALSNPGPVLLYALHPMVRVFGTDTGAWALAAFAGLAALSVAGWTATRRAGPVAGLIVAVGMVAMAASTNPGGFTHSLNTEVVLLPTFCCFILAWTVAAGDRRALPVLALVATFVVQTFVGAAPMVLAACCVAVAGLAWRFRHAPRRRELAWPVGITVAILAVLWAPPLEDQLLHTGNLTGLLGFRTPGRGASGAVESLWSSLDVFARGRGPAVLVSHRGRAALLILPSLLLAATVSGRRAARRYRHLLVVAFAVTVASAFTTFVDPPTDTASYHFFNVGLTRWLLVVTIALIVAEVLRERAAAAAVARPRLGAARALAGRAVIALGSVALVLLAASMIRADVDDPQHRNQMLAVTSLSQQLDAELPPRARVQLVSRGGSSNGNVAQGVRARLRSSGRSVATAFEAVGRSDVVLVVTAAGPGSGGLGSRVAAFRPSPGDWPPPDVAGAVEWLRQGGEVRLSPSGRDSLADRVDGSRPALCVAALRSHPERLVDLPAPTVLLLLRAGEIDRPVQPPAVSGDLYRWEADQGFEVRKLPASGAWRRSFAFEELFLSRSNCGS